MIWAVNRRVLLFDLGVAFLDASEFFITLFDCGFDQVCQLFEVLFELWFRDRCGPHCVESRAEELIVFTGCELAANIALSRLLVGLFVDC